VGYTFIGFWVIAIGWWNIHDAIFSISLYLNKDGYHGKKQTWRKDHWVRVVRLIGGIALLYFGAELIGL